MKAQKNIAKPLFSDAFLSKNADGDYLSNNCFFARCRNDLSFYFTGKEKDPLRLYLQSGELCRARLTSPPDLLTGYSYFGARYLDHELMTTWLSVDPMADKYPSISPYAYCAWNPVKLVDLEGKEIDLTALSKEKQKKLLECLSQVTGLSLYIDNGKIKYDNHQNKALFSAKARKDLIAAIDDKDYSIVVAESNYDFCNRETGKLSLYNDDYTSCSEIPYNAIIGLDFLSDQDDFSTYGLSMSFMHELLHGFYNYEDPTEDENKSTFYDISQNEIQIKRRIEQTASYKRGKSVVGRVNEYRRELGWDIRMTYAEHKRKGLPFQSPNGTIYWIKKNSSVPKL